jgi:uncharacterized membrane protein YgdD (TMEM256/DUF423 family)
MHKNFLMTGAVLGAIAVALGAFGAHSLKQIVSPETVNTFDTGVRYQVYHTLALFIAAILFERFPNKWIKWAGWAFIIGIILFSGSLYMLTALKATDKTGLEGVGIVTPFGGLFFIAGWVCLGLGVRNSKFKSQK